MVSLSRTKSQYLNGSGPSPLWPILERFVREECEKLERNQITPWAFLNAGPPMKVKDYHGGEISYQGIGFEGSPRQVFWARYIEPFLEDITFRAVDFAVVMSAEKKVDSCKPLSEVQGLLVSYTSKIYSRMAEIDRRLLGRGFPEKVPLRSTVNEQRAMEQLINTRVAAEMRMVPSPSSRWKSANQWVKDHPIATSGIGTGIAILTLIAKLAGVW
jgi:hypothetical protein